MGRHADWPFPCLSWMGPALDFKLRHYQKFQRVGGGMRKQERNAEIRRLAREMAQTGRYRDFRQIEIHLRASGWPGARTALDDSFVRRELNLACQGKSIYSF